MGAEQRAPLRAFLKAYSDSSFTNPHEVVRPDEPPACTGRFTHMGAMYWGFETARHRATRVLPGGEALRFDHDAHHWLTLGLVQPAEIDALAISTRWFTGNQVPEVSVELRAADGTARRVLERVKLAPDSEHHFEFSPVPASECHIECYHEGGIARIQLFGTARPDAQSDARENLLESAQVSHVSNAHYGHPDDAIRGRRLEDHMKGWESARSGFGEQALFHLASPAVIEEIIVDTYLHRLNPPLSCHVFGILAAEDDIERHLDAAPAWTLTFDDGTERTPEDFQAYMREARYLEEDLADNRAFNVSLRPDPASAWVALLPFAPLAPDTWHTFGAAASGPVSHVLYMHYPNGGIHGLRMLGRPAPP
ncbi:MAG: hypothetical protein HKO62_10930 [Gammaproteobacteria bacterium]|nr:hypothetical protein [Gammaproteobacteria bacterium]